MLSQAINYSATRSLIVVFVYDRTCGSQSRDDGGSNITRQKRMHCEDAGGTGRQRENCEERGKGN